MGIYVTWGNKHLPYDKTKINYNSEFNKWNRYTENIKRGYVLKNQQNIWIKKIEDGKIINMDEKPENPILLMDFTHGLMKIEEYRNIGFDILSKTSDEDMKDRLKSMIKEISKIFNKEYHRWGLDGDEYSPSNNPFKK